MIIGGVNINIYKENDFDYLYSQNKMQRTDILRFFWFVNSLDLRYTKEQVLSSMYLKNFQISKDYVRCKSGKHSKIYCIDDFGEKYIACLNEYKGKDRCKLISGYRYFTLKQLDLSGEQIERLKRYAETNQRIIKYVFLPIFILSWFIFFFCSLFNPRRRNF